MNALSLSGLLAGALLLSGCAYRKPLGLYVPPQEDARHSVCALAAEHPLYQVVPRHREQLAWYDIPRWVTWAFVGNDDNGIFGEHASTSYSTNLSAKTFCSWAARNPGHNLTFYVLGSAEKEAHACFAVLRARSEAVKAMTKTQHGVVKSRWEFELALHDEKPYVGWRVPYGSRVFDGYFGWRHRGNFGMKFRPLAKNRHDGEVRPASVFEHNQGIKD